MTSFGRDTRRFDRISSTQDIARELAAQGAGEGTVVVAREQTGGRGRLGRQWVSPRGGLYLSIVLRPLYGPSDAPKITIAAAVGVAGAIEEIARLTALIKWPNDILVGARKVAGILTEASAQGERLESVILGIGVNANVDTESFPPGLLMPATSLRQELGRSVDLGQLEAAVLRHVEGAYGSLGGARFAQILNAWRERSAIIGQAVAVATPSEKLTGRAIDVDECGALILELESGERRVIQAGDVTVSSEQ